MNININHYHHLGAEEVKLLQQLKQLHLPVSAKLDGILEKLKIMSEKEEQQSAELKAQLDAIQVEQKAANERGEKQIARLTNLVQELQTANENTDVDLSGLITSAKTILQMEKESFRTGEPTEETPPFNPGEAGTEELPPEPTVPESSGEETGETSETNASSVPPGETLEESNQPFDPSPAETQTDGFDDQERTPVPHPDN